MGGVFSGRDAVEFLVAGADAVQVGTATFRDPKAPWKVLRQVARWCDAQGTTVEASVNGRVAASRRAPTRPRRNGAGAQGIVVPSRHEGGSDG